MNGKKQFAYYELNSWTNVKLLIKWSALTLYITFLSADFDITAMRPLSTFISILVYG